MPLSLEAFARLRPSLFHYTARANLNGIRAERALFSVRALGLGSAAARRVQNQELELNGRSVIVRDQLALQRGHVELVGGWTWQTLLDELDSRVFFWPGAGDLPIRHGQRLARHYRGADEVVLRVEFRALLDVNAERPPYFCKYNSGGPRTVQVSVQSG
jgi:hypothetical protein